MAVIPDSVKVDGRVGPRGASRIHERQESFPNSAETALVDGVGHGHDNSPDERTRYNRRDGGRTHAGRSDEPRGGSARQFIDDRNISGLESNTDELHGLAQRTRVVQAPINVRPRDASSDSVERHVHDTSNHSPPSRRNVFNSAEASYGGTSDIITSRVHDSLRNKADRDAHVLCVD
eukprot:Lankesteria_metandrocarpae@DN11253_c0_g1_i1.p1